jgi:hypothetical protein
MPLTRIPNPNGGEMLRFDPPGMRHMAVLARVERIRPNPDGSGKLTYRGPVHIFNGHHYWNDPGTLTAWCGARVAGTDLHGIKDRDGKPGALYSDVCRRCFNEPRKNKGEPQ